GQRFPLVSVHCCPESITDNREDFERVLGNITRLVAERGTFFMSMIVQSKYWTVGAQQFPTFEIPTEHLSELLLLQGLTVMKVATAPSAPGRSYLGLVGIVAQRQ
ncbi:MAG: hypothetical protein KDD69_20230, partial [Bdellovibrionales bacterium]|nr:hypothetical protein [Bdellovibrionales bacterium]